MFKLRNSVSIAFVVRLLCSLLLRNATKTTRGWEKKRNCELAVAGRKPNVVWNCVEGLGGYWQSISGPKHATKLIAVMLIERAPLFG